MGFKDLIPNFTYDKPHFYEIGNRNLYQKAKASNIYVCTVQLNAVMQTAYVPTCMEKSEIEISSLKRVS